MAQLGKRFADGWEANEPIGEKMVEHYHLTGKNW